MPRKGHCFCTRLLTIGRKTTGTYTSLTNDMMPKTAQCPICLTSGSQISKCSSDDLLREYENYYQLKLPDTLKAKFFTHQFVENFCPSCALRWYFPKITGDSEYYGYLANALPTYYSSCQWDKKFTLDFFSRENIRSFTDYGCGDGTFLSEAAPLGITGNGIDLSESAVAKTRDKGFDCSLPDANDNDFIWNSTVTLFQTLEHVSDPVDFLKSLADRSQCETLVLSVPTFESLLGYTDDPLSWPPHHVTMWSAKALRRIADKIGFDLDETAYEPLDWEGFQEMWAPEKTDRLPGCPIRFKRQPSDLRIRYVFAKYLAGRLFRCRWALYRHTLVAVLRRRNTMPGL